MATEGARNMETNDPKMSHSQLHALVEREINKRLDEEARQRWEQQQKQGQAK
jgi:hypothetical protein